MKNCQNMWPVTVPETALLKPVRKSGSTNFPKHTVKKNKDFNNIIFQNVVKLLIVSTCW